MDDICESYSEETIFILWSDLCLDFKPKSKKTQNFLFLVQWPNISLDCSQQIFGPE